MGVLGGASLKYPDVMAAIGRFIAKKHIEDVCVLEFEHGVIVTGSVLFETGEGYNRRVETYVLSFDDVRKLMREG